MTGQPGAASTRAHLSFAVEGVDAGCHDDGGAEKRQIVGELVEDDPPEQDRGDERGVAERQRARKGAPHGENRLAKEADALARIPQQGRADSLNLGIATGIMLFEARRHLLTLDGKA